MCRFYLAPGVIAQPHRRCRGADNAGEHKGSEHSIELKGGKRAGKENLNRPENRLLITREYEMIDAGQLDELSSWNSLREIASPADVDVQIACAMQYQGWHPDRRE